MMKHLLMTMFTVFLAAEISLSAETRPAITPTASFLFAERGIHDNEQTSLMLFSDHFEIRFEIESVHAFSHPSIHRTRQTKLFTQIAPHERP